MSNFRKLKTTSSKDGFGKQRPLKRDHLLPKEDSQEKEIIVEGAPPVNQNKFTGSITTLHEGEEDQSDVAVTTSKKLSSTDYQLYAQKLSAQASGLVEDSAGQSKAEKERISTYIEDISRCLKDALDARWIMASDENKARAEINDAIQTVIDHKGYKLTPKETKIVSYNICSDIMGLGPLEELFERDDISDIMVNGPDEIFIEVEGKIKKTDICFRNAQHLMSVCTRIVTRVGRRVDESSPICDARLSDGSRVNIILPPLSLNNGAVLTIRRFQKEKLTLDKLLEFGTIDERGAILLQILSACRVNILISGGTGSGKTTLLNCLTKYINASERIITCEDAAELQLQQPHVVSLETRPANTEGVGEVTMRDLVRNCLRMRPERIIVGEVRGAEAFDLLQAMNTGHDGSMGTLHANTPREALARLENMVAMANLNIPTEAIREQIASSLNIIIQVQRLKDGSRKITNISEITGMETGIISLQDLMVFKMLGEDQNGDILGEFESTGLRPRFYENARQYGLEGTLLDIMGVVG